MVSKSSPLLLVAIALLATPLVDAHGVISKPAPKFKGTEYAGGFSADVPPDTMPAISPDKYTFNVAWGDVFAKSWKQQTKYKSLRQYILTNQVTANRVKNSNPMTPECGFTDPDNQDPQPLPDKVEWYGGGMNHPGPCEGWCDNEIVIPHTDNCQKTYPDGKFPYDKAKCVGKNRFTFYWMATLYQFQVYIDCIRIGKGAAVPFDNGTGGGSASAGNSTTPAIAAPDSKPAPAPAPATAQTSAPAPKKDTAAGEATTPSTGAKCKRKL